MMEIWKELDRFKATNQRLADRVRTLSKNGRFTGLEIQESHQQIYRQTHQETLTTLTKTTNTGIPETSNQTLLDKDHKQTNANIDSRGKTNIDTIKRIMSKNKTTLPSLRNQDWRTVRFETEKVNDLLIDILANNITE